MNGKRKLLSTLFATALLAACSSGGGLSGTYAGPHGMTSYTFDSGGNVEMKSMGASTKMHYEMDGQTIKVGAEGGPMAPIGVLQGNTIVLKGPGHRTLTKQ